MGYKNLTAETLLENVHVYMYNASSGLTEKLYSMYSTTAELVIDNIQSRGVLNSSLNEVLEEDFPKEVMLNFKVDGKEVSITIIDTTSKDNSEWISVDPQSEILIDSIMFCRDLVTEIHKDYIKGTKRFKTLEEYYSKAKAKSILIESLIGKLEEEQFYSSDMFGHKSFVSLKEDTKPYSNTYNKFKYIPNYCLRSLINNFEKIKNECGEEKTASTFLAVASKAGMLNFRPYITKNSHGTTTLVLKYNRYVHLFRGYHYQCSYTADGIGEYSSASVRIDRLKSIFGEDLRNSKLLKMFYYMNLISCCRELDVFNKLLRTDPDLVDTFMKKSTEDIFDNYDVTYTEDMIELVNFVSGDIPPRHEYFNKLDKSLSWEPLKIFRVPANDTSDVCRVRVYNTNCISVEFWLDNSVKQAMFVLPAWEDEYSQDELARFAEEECMDVKEYIKFMSNKIYDSPESYYSLMNFALNTCGCIANFMAIYPDRSLIKSNLRALNNNDVKECNTLNDVNVEGVVKLREELNIATNSQLNNTDKEPIGFMAAIDFMSGK